MKKVAVFVFGLAIVVAGFARAPIALAYGSGTIMLSASDTSVSTGEEFTVSIWVDPAGESLDTVRINLNYNPALIEGVGFDLGDQFPSLSPGYSINATTGVMTFGGFKFGERVGTSGLFATATFKALSEGMATIEAGEDSKLINDGEEKVSATGFGSVIVSTSGETVAGTEVAAEASLEQQGLVYFGAFAGRMPSSAVDWEALHCMAYDTCYPTDPALRRVDREAISLQIFGEKYAHIPVTSMDWKALHAIAYTEIFYDWSAIDGEVAEEAEEEVAVVEVEAEEEEVVVAEVEEEEVSADEAIGIFGRITGRLPSSSEDWLAVDYMQNGYVAATQDSDAEGQAISLFGSVYGRLPSSSADWNVIAAIAYSGAIL